MNFVTILYSRSHVDERAPQLESAACKVVVVVRVLSQLRNPEESVEPCHVAEGPDVPGALRLEVGVVLVLGEHRPVASLLGGCLENPAAKGFRVPGGIVAQEVRRGPDVPPLDLDRNRLHRLGTRHAPLHDTVNDEVDGVGVLHPGRGLYVDLATQHGVGVALQAALGGDVVHGAARELISARQRDPVAAHVRDRALLAWLCGTERKLVALLHCHEREELHQLVRCEQAALPHYARDVALLHRREAHQRNQVVRDVPQVLHVVGVEAEEFAVVASPGEDGVEHLEFGAVELVRREDGLDVL
mmetsp:Transcript_16360/g.63859  ORF Transcript_16360/g.63859 Transcript_16360/m.63859 type:complete len:301 (-) Transcript_16360:1112-2014(-)